MRSAQRGHQAATDVHSVLVHGDRAVAETNAVSAPIWQTANFFYEGADEFQRQALRVHPDHFYTRYGNPSCAQVETLIARLEGTEAAICAASGMGAMSLAVLAHVRAGDHVVTQASHYAGTSALVDHVLPGLGVSVTRVDQTDTEAFAAAVTPATRLFILETPSNPMHQLTDLAEVCRIARGHEIVTILDSTFATPLNCQPARLGVDIVMHSATKYISGHSDVIAGILAGSKESIDRMWKLSIVLGATLGPLDAWLVLRGLRTMALRVAQHNLNAGLIAAFLQSHPEVAAVHYPRFAHAPAARTCEAPDDRRLRRHAQLRGARRLRRGVAGRLAVAAAEDRAEPRQRYALVVQPASLWASEMDAKKLAEAGIPAGLMRYAAGIEAADDLIADLDAALNG